MLPFIGSKDLARAWRAAHLVPIEDVGHGHITRDPRVISQTIGFLSMFRAEELLLGGEQRVKTSILGAIIVILGAG